MAKRPLPSFLVFRDKEGHWRWNLAGPGGRILAASSQAYTRSAGCLRVIKLLKTSGAIPVISRGADIAAANQRSEEDGGAAKVGAAAPAAKAVKKV